MHVEIEIPGADQQGRIFLGWALVAASLRLVDGGGTPVRVNLRNMAGTVGHLVFAATRSNEGESTLELELPANGTPVQFWIAGEFGHPSLDYGDAKVEAVDTGSVVLGSRAVMVRVRKNAVLLTPAERDRFLAAFGTLNGQGAGRFVDFRDMHVTASEDEAHGNVGFLPWHRAYLLDLERELQNIDPTVALPYWRFDQPAPSLFTTAFLGAPGTSGTVRFDPGHPLEFWTTDAQPGINRTLNFPATNAPPGLSDEDATLDLGTTYGDFISMEGDPHGFAHTSFGGFIRRITTAARDPLFFMLHANVDRLWAKWQWRNRRSDFADPGAYSPPPDNRIGHRLADTMWPWNGVTAPPRPPTAPGGRLAATVVTSAPGPTPLVQSMLDYLAVVGGDHLGFAYDDVPFEVAVVA